MTPNRRVAWPAWLLLALGLAMLYARPLSSGFLNDDHLFLEQARSELLRTSLTRLDPLANYVRPVSRQLWFALLGPIGGGDPRVFHAASALVFAIALVLLADLLAVFAPPIGVLAGVAFLALLPLTRVLLTWVSCSQDLLALMFTLAALACFRRGRDGVALVMFALAAFSKESALAFPLVALAWSRLIDRDAWPRALRRVAGFGIVVAAWLVVTLALRRAAPHVAATLVFTPGSFAAALVHGAQTLLGLDSLAGWREPFARTPGVWLAAAPIVLAGLWLAWPAPRGTAPTPADPSAPASTLHAPREGITGGLALRIGTLWLIAFALVVGPVAASWSGYFYALAAVGGALLIAHATRRLDRTGWILLVALALTVHGLGASARAFAVADDPWGWTSHLNAAYFDRAAALTDTLEHQLVAREPHPAHDTRFFFATLPPWAGFQMGNGALIRSQYRDPTLRSYFYSQFSESTAGWAPVRILYWDGAALTPLYDRAPDPWFQVGSDLLLFDRPAGAVHAFRRGLDAGESRFDLLYWLGWSELWLGHRDAAERAWLDAGLRDDTTAWFASMRRARTSLIEERDTLTARRAIAEAILAGPGQPLPHALLGQLLLRERPKYALLELRVATWLRPGDRESRRALIVGLTAQRLDDQARLQLAWFERNEPGWRQDPGLAAAARTLASRSLASIKVARF